MRVIQAGVVMAGGGGKLSALTGAMINTSLTRQSMTRTAAPTKRPSRRSSNA